MSSPEKQQTNMTNPPKAQTHMVKIKLKRDIRLVAEQMVGGKPIMVENIHKAGEVVEVTEAEAVEYCDRSFDLGIRGIFGNVDPGYTQKTVVKRAIRVKDLQAQIAAAAEAD